MLLCIQNIKCRLAIGFLKLFNYSKQHFSLMQTFQSSNRIPTRSFSEFFILNFLAFFSYYLTFVVQMRHGFNELSPIQNYNLRGTILLVLGYEPNIRHKLISLRYCLFEKASY